MSATLDSARAEAIETARHLLEYAVPVIALDGSGDVKTAKKSNAGDHDERIRNH